MVSATRLLTWPPERIRATTDSGFRRSTEETSVHCEPRDAGGAAELQLLHERLAVRFDRPDADPEVGGDLLVRAAARDLDQHFPLPAGERREAVALLLRRSGPANRGRQRAGSRSAEKAATLMNDADRAAQLRRRGILAQVPLRARTDALQHVLLAVVDAEHENAHVRRSLANLCNGLE